MIPKIFFMVTLFVFIGQPSEENSMYHKEYYPSGKMKAQGWLQNGTKSNFWKYYYPNGKVSQEGHYKNNRRVSYWKFFTADGKPSQEGHYQNGLKNDWWLFYDGRGKVDYKCQFGNDRKDGYCLNYKNGELASAVKYSHGKKIKEWYSFSSFTKENSLSDLR